MKWTAILMLLFISWGSNRDGGLNLAKEAYEEGDYLSSINHYRRALKTYPQQSTLIHYNLAQCMMKIDSVELALQYYHLVLNPLKAEVSSMAQNNIGIIYLQQGRKDEALNAFRSALVRNEHNEYARYNYELLKKNMPPPKAPVAPPPSQEPPPPSSEDNQAPQDEPEAKPPVKPPSKEFQELVERIRRRMQQNRRNNDRAQPLADSLSLAQARQLLDHLKKEDLQFIQQLKKTYSLSSRNNRNRPNW